MTIKGIYKSFLNKFKPLKYMEKVGVNFPKGKVKIFGKVAWGSEPWIITLGENVYITDGVKFITHDGGTLLYRNKIPDLENIYGEVAANKINSLREELKNAKDINTRIENIIKICVILEKECCFLVEIYNLILGGEVTEEVEAVGIIEETKKDEHFEEDMINQIAEKQDEQDGRRRNARRNDFSHFFQPPVSFSPFSTSSRRRESSAKTADFPLSVITYCFLRSPDSPGTEVIQPFSRRVFIAP